MIVIDDPYHVATEAARAKARVWWAEQAAAMQERFSGPPVIIMSRLHDADLPGVVELKGEWDYLTIPPETAR